MIYAIVVAVICLVFAVQVGRDYQERRRPYQGIWTVALALSFAGAACYALAVVLGSQWAFRLYYVFGALWVAPYMGLGSLFLVLPQPLARRVAAAVTAALVAATVPLFTAEIDPEAFAALAGSSGQGVFVPGAWLIGMILLNIFGTAAVVGVALYSAWRAYRHRSELGFMWGNLTIGLGFLILAMAGSVARWLPRWDGGFWVAMALGWIIAYVGFRIVTAAGEAKRQAAANAAAAQ